MHELTAQLEHYLKVLRLPGILLHYRDLSDQATRKKLHYDEYLTLVLEAEVKHKQEASVKTKVTTARFPYVKTIEQFDFSFQPSLNEKEIARLGSLAFIEAKCNVIFLGPPGVGKTHLGVKAWVSRPAWPDIVSSS